MAFKNLQLTFLRSVFTILIIALSTALVTITVLIEEQYQKHIENNLQDIDLILVAKGNPLQSVLANVFHADAPTGNIQISDIKPFLNPNHPILKDVLPISIGDNYHGFRIVGVTESFLEFYNLKLEKGNLFRNNFEAVLGSNVMHRLKLKLEDTFISGHGFQEDTDHNHEQKFIIRGQLEKTNTLIDNLIFVPISTYWSIHHTEIDSLSSKCILLNDVLANQNNASITALLLRFKGTNVQSLNFARNINNNSNIMAASPPMELNRLFELTGSAADLLHLLAWIIAGFALISILLSLFQNLNERKLELALIRMQGGSRMHILELTLFEGMILILLGLFVGACFTHLFLECYASSNNLIEKYNIRGFIFLKKEIWFFISFIILGVLCSLIPALRSFNLNLHESLKSR